MLMRYHLGLGVGHTYWSHDHESARVLRVNASGLKEPVAVEGEVDMCSQLISSEEVAGDDIDANSDEDSVSDSGGADEVADESDEDSEDERYGIEGGDDRGAAQVDAIAVSVREDSAGWLGHGICRKWYQGPK